MTVRLRPMTPADLPGVMVLEEELFAPDTWTEATPTYIYANGSTSANIAGGSIVIH